MIGWSFYAHHVNGWDTSVNGWSFYASCQRLWLWIQGFPWRCPTWKLLSLFRLYRMCPVYWSSFPSRMCPVYWSPSPMYLVERFFPTRSSYANYPVQWFVLHGANTYVMHSESRLCRFAVASLRFLRSDELFQHHTSSSRSRKDCSHKRRHQGSR